MVDVEWDRQSGRAVTETARKDRSGWGNAAWQMWWERRQRAGELTREDGGRGEKYRPEPWRMTQDRQEKGSET